MTQRIKYCEDSMLVVHAFQKSNVTLAVDTHTFIVQGFCQENVCKLTLRLTLNNSDHLILTHSAVVESVLSVFNVGQ